MSRSRKFRPATIQPLEERVVLSHAHAPSAAVIQGRLDGKVQQAFLRYEANYARAATTAPFLFEGRVQRGVEGLDVGLARTLGKLPNVDDTLLPAIDRELVGNGDSLLTKLSALQPSATGPGASAASRASVGNAAIDAARQQVLAQVNLFFGNPGYNFLTPPATTIPVQAPTAAPAPANPAPQGGLTAPTPTPAPATAPAPATPPAVAPPAVAAPVSPAPTPAPPVTAPPLPPVVTPTPMPAIPATPVVAPTSPAPSTPPPPAGAGAGATSTPPANNGSTPPAAPTPTPTPPHASTPPAPAPAPSSPAPVAPAPTPVPAGPTAPTSGGATTPTPPAAPTPPATPAPPTGGASSAPSTPPATGPAAPGSTGPASGPAAPTAGGTSPSGTGSTPAAPTPPASGSTPAPATPAPTPSNPPVPVPTPPAGQDPGFNTPHDLPITVLAQGSQLVTQVDEDAVFRDQASWQRFWDAHVANTTYSDGTHPDAPQVDFSKQMVVVSIIYRPSSGYSLTLDHVTTDHGQVTVDTTEHRPGAASAVKPGTTQPYVFAAVPREDGNVSFRHQVVSPDSD